MRDEIFKLLKQAYSRLGFGDDFLMARATMLDSLGFVTSENVNDVVAKQSDSLTALQRMEDSRVASALKKAKEEAEKKAAEEAEKKAKEAAEEKAKEAARKAAEDVTKTEGKLNDSTGLTPELKAFLEGIKTQMDEQKKTYEKQVLSLSESLKSLKDQNEKDAAAKAKAERRTMILNKAKELGIPQSRIDEGFVIADDADETAIASYLGTVKRNIDANKLPSDNRFALEGKALSDSELDTMANALLGNN
nr:MAG TPA: hypothetical protein [Caudoviricetes sp.]